MANSVDPDQRSHSAVSHLGLPTLFAQACLSQYLGLLWFIKFDQNPFIGRSFCEKGTKRTEKLVEERNRGR